MTRSDIMLQLNYIENMTEKEKVEFIHILHQKIKNIYDCVSEMEKDEFWKGTAKIIRNQLEGN